MTALLLAASGHEADAARVAREALAVYPEQLALYEVLAEACAKQGDSTCARQAARRAIDVAARREDLAPFARARAIDALRARWLATPAPR
jgi:predicted Zn-dependent protease